MDFLLESLKEAFRLVLGGDRVTYHAVSTSIICTVTAVTLASLTAIPYGAWLGFYRPGSRFQVLALRLGMSVPTVIIGLFIYLLLSRRGLFGSLDLLYTQSAIIVGEFLLAFPLLGTLAHGVASSLDRVVIESARTLGASRLRALALALGECRPAIVGAILAGFGRCLTELGIAITVGGNLAERTRTLPGAIQLELSRGQFARALAPGLILLAIALVVTIASQRVSGEERR